MEKLKKKVREMLETWTNGNRKDVIEELLELDGATAIVVGSQVCVRLPKDQQEVFYTLLTNRSFEMTGWDKNEKVKP